MMILRRVLRQKMSPYEQVFGSWLRCPKKGRLWDGKNLRYFAAGDRSVGFTPSTIGSSVWKTYSIQSLGFELPHTRKHIR